MITDNQEKKYDVEDYIKDKLSKKHDNKTNRMIRQETNDGILVIGKNRYDALKKIPSEHLLEKQKIQIKDFEDFHGITDYLIKAEEQKKQSEVQLAEIEKRKHIAKSNINKETVKKVFLQYFEKINNKPFKQSKENLSNIEPLILYFAKDDAFLKHGAKKSDGTFHSKPDLDKGLCIIGGFGNGKTSIMNTFQKMFIGLDEFSFGRFSAHEIVLRYEEAAKHNHPEILENFWKILTRSTLYIDDVKAEPDALAYGRKNLLNTLFQERYNKKLVTHISINYQKGANHDVSKALQEFKTKYSNQVYDRIFEMYNIIEFQGKSFRK